MELSYTDDQNRFREEVRTWISEAMPPVIKKKAEDGANFENSETMEWHKILFKKGWVAPNWPEEIGGPGWDVAERSIFQEECVRAGTPGLSPFGLSMVGPLLIQFGSPEQKERFLRPLRRRWRFSWGVMRIEPYYLLGQGLYAPYIALEQGYRLLTLW